MSNEHDGYGVSEETFQAIIQERKAEKHGRAEEKRLALLKSIQNRKSKTGIDPLEQFPKEVWEMVLDELKEPKDLSNLSKVHGVFDGLLEGRKMRDILFPQVVDLPIQTNPSPHAQILPLACDLNMRAVSKSMRNGVDRWQEDNLLQHLRIGKNLGCNGIPTIFLEKSKVVKGLLENYVGSGTEDTKAKRFVRRSIWIVLSANFPEDNVQDEAKQRFQEQCAQTRNDIKSLLEVIGDQVWYCVYLVGSIDFLERGGITPSQIYDTLLEYAELMPNLKWLEITFGNLCPGQRKGVSIKSYLANHPFPKLEHLERLDVESQSTSIEVFEIFEAIFSANQHLRRLHIDGYNDDILERLSVARVQQMDSLETFCVGNEADHYFTWDLIQPFINFQWHLKQIQLSLWNDDDGNDVFLVDVFQVLEKFQTLEHVALNFKKIEITGDLQFLKLPNLTQFELVFDPIIDFWEFGAVQFFFSLQFLFYCKKLRKLHWENQNQWKLRRFMINRECPERMITFSAGYGNLDDSNIWDVFPYLDTIEIELAESHRGSRFMAFRIMEFKRANRRKYAKQYIL